MYYVPQIQKDDCGYACVKMLLANVQKDKNFLFLPQDENHGPYSYQDLIDIAKGHGIILNGYTVEDKSTIKEHKKFPIIVTLATNSGGSHAVLVYKVSLGRVQYLDPRLGKLETSIRKFVSKWDGTLLSIESVEKKECPYKEAKPLSLGNTIALNFLEVMAGVSAIAGVYFINNNAYVFIPIALFALAVVFELFVKAYSVSLMKRIDSYFYGQIEVKDNKYHQAMLRFERYKKGLLANPLNFILTLVVAMGLMFITLHNDIHNFLLIAAPLVASVIEFFFYNPYLRSGYMDIQDLEQQLDASTDEDDFRLRMDVLHQKTYRLGLLEMSKQYIGLALFIIMAVTLLAITGTASFPYAVFYTCIEIAIYICFHRLLSYPDKMDEMMKAKVEINNYLHQNDEK